ncbi:MAG: fibronectin type III domain-containing protein, partial [Actinomycetes bacterium]
GYTVTSSPGGFTCTTNGAFTCTINGLSNGTAYTFTVTATNTNGTSDPSSASNAVTPSATPTQPLNVTALASSGQAVVSWLPPTSNSGSAITGYTVTSSPGGLTCTTTGATTCVVSGLTNGTAYTFTVTATNGNGTSLASAPSDSVTPSSIPSAPQGPSAVAGNGQAVVSWNPPARDGGTPITGYAVTAFDPNGQIAGTCTTADGTTLSCAVFNLTNGVAYTFTVAASNVNGTGLSSGPSAPVTPSAIPTKPLTVTAVGGNGQATVSWLAPSSNGGSAITGYTVTAFSGATPVGNCTTSGAFSCVVTGLQNGTAYTFKVYATNVNGDGPNSDASSPVTPSTTPSAPSIVSVTPGNGQIAVAWTAPGSSNGSNITGYIATAYDQNQNVVATCTTSGALNCTINGLTNGLTYTVTIVATNVNGSGAASSSLTATPSTRPSAPVNVTAVAGNASAEVSWTVPATSGGSTILSYTVTAYVNSTPVTTCTTPDGSTLSCLVTGLTNGTAYTFKVTATNANGQSPQSLASSPSTTPTGNPGPPTGVQVTAGNGQLTATWTAPVSTGGSPITQFTATAYSGLTAIATCQTPDGVTTTCIITGLTNGTAYTVKVTATNVNGTGLSSLASSSATPSTKPNPPTAVSAVAGSGQATVSWTAPAFNGGSNITGYTVTSSPDFKTCTTQGSTSCTVT